ncbi:MAG: hypothetical protein HYY67_08290 [Thaumarchaeota archaeon]|nr:hypothetical protein [Nitrososphaerota archaeon]
MERLVRQFAKVYPSCRIRDIEDLVAAIRGNKYWNIHPGLRGSIYVVALTRAEIASKQGFLARPTHVGQIRVVEAAAKYCSKGRVLVAMNEGSGFEAVSVITWPAFLRFIRLDSSRIYEDLLSGQLPPFIGERYVAEIRQRAKASSQISNL